MAKNVTKTITWTEVAEKVGKAYFVPPFMVKQFSNTISKVLHHLISKNQPKSFDEQTSIRTPFGEIIIYRFPETDVIVERDGVRETVRRPEVGAIQIGVPNSMVDAANVGIYNAYTADFKTGEVKKKTL